jgi:hypothetical protein
MTTKTKREQALVGLLKWAAPLICSAIVAYSTAQFRAGAQESATQLKISSLEQRFTALDSNVVPRKEDETHWQAIEELLKSQQTDLRELRSTQKEILLRLPK